jgi:alkanesulfonate monooxygenase SsuD/methylene tetrahydromethanopterin reductase-like flavin-dependent oxidoreductase (luciferase family)
LPRYVAGKCHGTLIAATRETPMKFGNFMFSESRDPARDGVVIDEVMAEAKLCDALGMDALWLAEHHFSGTCVFADPVALAAALAVATDRIAIGFAVAQMSLVHPIRFAEQMALIDNLSKGRLIVGMGRGTGYNIHEYDGYGVAFDEAQARFEEVEEVMLKAWQGDAFEHHGRFWSLHAPPVRPRPFTKPHPPIIRGSHTEKSMVEFARAGRPFLMNIQSVEATKKRMDLYRATMRDAGYDQAAIARNVADCWIMRNVFVAETDAEAEATGRAMWHTMYQYRDDVIAHYQKLKGVTIRPPEGVPARNIAEHSLICGSPATVAAKIAELDACGIGGVMMTFKMGPMSYAQAAHSIALFMREVAPQFRSKTKAAHEAAPA